MLMALLLIFMSLQKTYWPYYFRNDNLFMDKAHLILFFAPIVNSFNAYLIIPLLFPYVGYLQQNISKKD